MKPIIAILFILFTVHRVAAQDPEMEARLYYTKAEDIYNKAVSVNDYLQVLEQLKLAQAKLNRAAPNILYLRLKAMQKSGAVFYFVYPISTDLQLFFSTVDAKSYPAEKYTEMLQIKDELASVQQQAPELFARARTPGYMKVDSSAYLEGVACFGQVSNAYFELITLNVELYRHHQSTSEEYTKRAEAAYSPKRSIKPVLENRKIAGEHNVQAIEASGQIAKAQSDLFADKEYQNALAWYRMAADKGHLPAILALAECNERMHRASYAFDWYATGAAQGDAGSFAALCRIAEKTTRSYGVYAADLEKMRKTLSQFYARGRIDSLRAAYALGQLYQCEIMDWRTDYRNAVYWYERAANSGDVRSMKAAAAVYLSGKLAGEDKAKRETDNITGVTWLAKAAEQKDKEALNRLTFIYQTGIPGVKKDKKKGQEYAMIAKEVPDGE